MIFTYKYKFYCSKLKSYHNEELFSFSKESSAWLRWALDANALEPHFGRLESKASTYELFRSPSRMVISRFYSRHTFGQILSKKSILPLFLKTFYNSHLIIIRIFFSFKKSHFFFIPIILPVIHLVICPVTRPVIRPDIRPVI